LRWHHYKRLDWQKGWCGMGQEPLHDPGIQMLAAGDETEERRVPARFEEARASLRDEIARLAAAGVPDLTLVAVMLTEMIPRMVRESGPEWAAEVLTHLASNIRSTAAQLRKRQ
jgi:hypothetical protein